jgi:lipoprotein-anchoring transpeptidase ErfK/SrfK
MLERPGRVAAVGGAAVICVLSVSGALGISHTGAEEKRPAQATDASFVDARKAQTAHPGASIGGPDQAQLHAGTDGRHETTPTQTQSTALPARSGTGKRVVFDVSAQRVWLVNANGSVERTYPVSGSKYHNLDNGTYQVTSRSRYATAYNSAETMDYMVRFTTSNKSSTPIGFHSIPALPDGTLAEPRSGLGTPASDGCIREWKTDARALWDFAPEGTTVVVQA